MSITNYNELKTAVNKWVHRTDLTPMLDDFISIAEKRINRVLRVRAMESIDSLSMTVGSRFVDLPARFIEPISLTIIYGNIHTRLTPISVSKLSEVIKNFNGVPNYYAVGQQIEFDVQAGQVWDLSLHCLKGFDLSVIKSGTNWLLDNAPEIPLCRIKRAHLFANDDQNASKYELLLQQQIKDLTEQDGRSRTISKLTTDIAGVGNRFNFNRGF